jgi:hypothetical protein
VDIAYCILTSWAYFHLSEVAETLFEWASLCYLPHWQHAERVQSAPSSGAAASHDDALMIE